MTQQENTDVRVHLDRIVVRGHRVFGWGWATDRTRPIATLALRMQGDGWDGHLPASIGLERKDIAANFPGWVNAASSGFVVTGYLPGTKPRHAELDLGFADGTTTRVEVSHLAASGEACGTRWRHLTWVAKAAWKRLRRGDVRGVIERARSQDYGAPQIDEDDIARVLRPLLAGVETVCLVLDHNMGGGANHYRRRIVAARLAARQAVVLCTYNLPTLDYRLTVSVAGAPDHVFRVSTFEALGPLVDGANVAEIFVNSPVSFDEPLVLAGWLARMRKQHPRVRLTVTVHDYFPVCPSFVLLNAEGRFCNIPELSECDRCMSKHTASYVSLSPPTQVAPWRALWGACLQAADEVRCFSDASRRLLVKAYPGLDPHRIHVIPHEVEYFPGRPPRLGGGPLVVGIMGQISAQKGAAVVAELVRLVEREHPEARIVVLGTLDVAVESDRLKVTGPYTRDSLVDLVEANGINVFLFPSIWPETFSYVVAEMMALEAPIVAFDLGAPAERLRGRARTRLCSEVSARAALDALLDLHHEITAGEVPARSVHVG